MIEIQSYTGGMAETNGYLIVSDKVKLAIDAPEGMLDWLKTKSNNLDGLLLTHAHYDHVLDAKAISDHYQCEIMAHAQPTAELTLEDMLLAYGMAISIPSYEVAQIKGEGDRAVFGDLDFQIAHIPGHSPDSITFYSEKEQCVFGGDVLMQGSIGRCDLPGGSQNQLLTGIREKLLTLPEGVRLFPGHGPPTSIGVEKTANPFLI